MRMSSSQFKDWENKSVTLLGMSGVGKTVLANKLRRGDWYHYSGDYRIGTRYLDEAIMDNVKMHAMQVPFLKELLRTDSITISNKITFENLKPLSKFLGKLGNPKLGGLSLKEFSRRQSLHHRAEIQSMMDVPKFMNRSRSVYGYEHFVNDAGGSVCELDDPGVIQALSDCSIIVYIKASQDEERQLVERQVAEPKPMYYRPKFLTHQLARYLAEQKLASDAEIDPNEFARWIFPVLFAERIPRYEQIAENHGYVVSTQEVTAVANAQDFVELVASKM